MMYDRYCYLLKTRRKRISVAVWCSASVAFLGVILGPSNRPLNRPRERSKHKGRSITGTVKETFLIKKPIKQPHTGQPNRNNPPPQQNKLSLSIPAENPSEEDISCHLGWCERSVFRCNAWAQQPTTQPTKRRIKAHKQMFVFREQKSVLIRKAQCKEGDGGRCKNGCNNGSTACLDPVSTG
jgi:hypothetical protein